MRRQARPRSTHVIGLLLGNPLHTAARARAPAPLVKSERRKGANATQRGRWVVRPGPPGLPPSLSLSHRSEFPGPYRPIVLPHCMLRSLTPRPRLTVWNGSVGRYCTYYARIHALRRLLRVVAWGRNVGWIIDASLFIFV